MKNYFGYCSNTHGAVKRDSNSNKFWISNAGFKKPDGTPMPLPGKYYDNLEEVIDEQDPSISHFYFLENN